MAVSPRWSAPLSTQYASTNQPCTFVGTIFVAISTAVFARTCRMDEGMTCKYFHTHSCFPRHQRCYCCHGQCLLRHVPRYSSLLITVASTTPNLSSLCSRCWCRPVYPRSPWDRPIAGGTGTCYGNHTQPRAMVDAALFVFGFACGCCVACIHLRTGMACTFGSCCSPTGIRPTPVLTSCTSRRNTRSSTTG